MTCDDFVKRKSNMNIFLINENYHFVLNERCFLEPTANACSSVQEKYNRWVTTNNKSRCFLLATWMKYLDQSIKTSKLFFILWHLSKKCLNHPSNKPVIKLSKLLWIIRWRNFSMMLKLVVQTLMIKLKLEWFFETLSHVYL